MTQKCDANPASSKEKTQDDTPFYQVLRDYFGYDSFRGIQLDIIRSIASGHDTLGLMPTGGGKSIAFQVPALSMDGVCIVITPLVSLMHDQVMHLKERGIKAEYIHSFLTHNEIQKILDNAIYGAVKFLYVSPERLNNNLFLAKLHYIKVCFVAVDEAHCISQWGYDFRPSYLNIGKIRELLPDAPVLALTATATAIVMKDIQERLAFGEYSEKEPQVFRMSFRRENISYVVRHTEDKDAELLHILHSVEGSAIVYTRSREKTKRAARQLCDAGLKASYYHAGLDIAIKNRHQQLWQQDEIRIIVATNAFGMGIDKPDVRLVIHLDCPDSIEAYYQEAGRAGRDGKRSYAILLYNNLDRSNLLRRATIAFPEKDYIRKVYDHLAYFFELAVDTGEGACYEFDEDLFCKTYKHYPGKFNGAVSILQNAGFLNYERAPHSSPRVIINVSREELYTLSGMSPTEDSVLTALLRFYGSLFTDFTFIDDQMIARKCGITSEQLHVALKQLAQKRIIRYVPRRDVPLILYLRQRIDSKRLRIPREVYEDLQERMLQRLNALLHYADSTEDCREKMLVEYFGEVTECDCGHCDVCIDKKRNGEKSSKEARKAALSQYRQHIITLLSDYLPHSAGEFGRLGIPQKELFEIIEELRSDPSFHMDGPHVSLKKF